MKTIKIISVFAFAGTLALMACNKGGGGGSAAPQGAVGLTGCQNCFANPNVFLSGVKSSTGSGSWTFDLTVFVDPAQLAGYNINDPNLESYYRGTVALGGVLRVQGQLSNSCPLVNGDYSIHTISMGEISQGRINNLRLRAEGPNGNFVMMNLYSSVLYSSNPEIPVNRNSNSNRIGMNIQLESVNNIPCGLLATY